MVPDGGSWGGTSTRAARLRSTKVFGGSPRSYSRCVSSPTTDAPLLLQQMRLFSSFGRSLSRDGLLQLETVYYSVRLLLRRVVSRAKTHLLLCLSYLSETTPLELCASCHRYIIVQRLLPNFTHEIRRTAHRRQENDIITTTTIITTTRSSVRNFIKTS